LSVIRPQIAPPGAAAEMRPLHRRQPTLV
jgi:hypothetical protein